MGACSSAHEETARLKKKNIDIEREIAKAQLGEKNRVKILLLGAGESGKSTVFKQLRIIYGTPRSPEDLKLYSQVVRHNITVLMRKILQLIQKFELISLLTKDEEAAFDMMRASYMTRAERQKKERENGSMHPSQLASRQMFGDAEECVLLKEEIKILFRSETWTAAWLKRSTVNIVDGHNLFVQQIDEITAPDYVPTVDHVLNARLRTTAVMKEEYKIDDLVFEIYDAGGQRSERKKWLPNFTGVDAVIFVAALSEYDQKLAEATVINRMAETLNLFKSICNHHAFTGSPILLFLNKQDLFLEKLEISNIQDQIEFTDYTGSTSKEAVEYFIQKFRDMFIDQLDPDKRLFTHATVATNTKNIEFVWDSCKNIICEQNLRKCMFVY